MAIQQNKPQGGNVFSSPGFQIGKMIMGGGPPMPASSGSGGGSTGGPANVGNYGQGDPSSGQSFFGVGDGGASQMPQTNPFQRRMAGTAFGQNNGY